MRAINAQRLSDHGKAQRALAPKRYNATRNKGRKIPHQGGGHRNNFAREFTKFLIARGLSYIAATRRLNTLGWNLDVERLASGQRLPSTHEVNIICEVLHADAGTRTTMHRATARDYGFEV